MRENNLAYDREYKDIPDSPLLKNMTNQRTAGGVMIKAGKNKKIKVNIPAKESRSTVAKARRNTVLSVVLLSAMAFLVLFRALMITSGYEKLEAKNVQLEQIISENQKIQFKIDQMLDLKNIENIAKNTYNMGEPTKAQTIYINLDQTEEVKKVRENRGIFQAIKDFFGGIVEYFA
jgi:hypothetical protein